MQKGLIIILDGLGDRPSPELDGQTALEAANTPVMDKLVSKGRCGLVYPLSPGVPVDTHTGCGALIGIVPEDVKKLTRGPVEAAGVDLDMKPGDILCRANFATLEDDGVRIIDRRAERISEGTAELCQALQNMELKGGVIGSAFPASHHRVVLRLRGTNLSAAITDTDPRCTGIDRGVQTSQAIDPDDICAVKTAKALNDFSQQANKILARHPLNLKRITLGKLPANGLLFRGAGAAPIVRNLISHLGLTAAIITGERTLTGLGRLSNFSVIQQPGFTGMPDTDLSGKIQAARQALEDHDLVYVHIKAPDILSHSMDALGKKVFLELVDSAMAALSDIDAVIGVSADHSTDSNTGHHCGDPVPSLLWARNGRIDAETTFNETACIRGGLGQITANGYLLTLLDAMGRVPNYHLSHSVFFSEA